jgi:hypothetical protein
MSNTVSRFWDKYIEKLITCGIKQRPHQWYIKHIEDYKKFHEGKRLRFHNALDIERYLIEKGGKPF